MKQYVKERKKIFNYKTKCRLIYATLGLATKFQTLEKFLKYQVNLNPTGVARPVGL